MKKLIVLVPVNEPATIAFATDRIAVERKEKLDVVYVPKGGAETKILFLIALKNLFSEHGLISYIFAHNLEFSETVTFIAIPFDQWNIATNAMQFYQRTKEEHDYELQCSLFDPEKVDLLYTEGKQREGDTLVPADACPFIALVEPYENAIVQRIPVTDRIAA